MRDPVSYVYDCCVNGFTSIHGMILEEIVAAALPVLRLQFSSLSFVQRLELSVLFHVQKAPEM